MLRNLVVVFAVAVLAVLSGCASLPRDTAFEVQEKSTDVSRQEPWQNRAINRTALTTAGVAVQIVKLPEPAPKAWFEDVVDPARVYTLSDGDVKTKKILVREVFRAVFYRDETAVGFSDAVLNPSATHFTILVPIDKMEVFRGTQVVVVTSDGRHVLTTRGKTVELPKGQSLSRLPAGFFRDYPSPTGEFVPMLGWEKYGQAFLTELLDRFSLPFVIRGERYLGLPDVVEVLARFTGLNTAADKLLSCTSLKLGPEDLAGGAHTLPVKVVIYAGQAMYALSREDCLK